MNRNENSVSSGDIIVILIVTTIMLVTIKMTTKITVLKFVMILPTKKSRNKVTWFKTNVRSRKRGPYEKGSYILYKIKD